MSESPSFSNTKDIDIFFSLDTKNHPKFEEDEQQEQEQDSMRQE
jgi:hypothetical protein